MFKKIVQCKTFISCVIVDLENVKNVRKTTKDDT